MIDPASLFLAGDAAGHSAFGMFDFAYKRFPQSRLKKWKKAAKTISQDALAHKETLQEDQIPKYLSRYAASVTTHTNFYRVSHSCVL
jgi:hypothetical protein